MPASPRSRRPRIPIRRSSKSKSDYFDAASKREEPRWFLVDVRFKRKLKRVIPLAELKDRKELDGFALLARGNRLSVLPVTKQQWDFILGLE